MTNRQTKNRLHRTPFVLITLLLCLAAGNLSAAQWRAKRVPLEETIAGICFPSSQIGYVVTSGGKYGATYDGGESWTVFSISDKAVLEDVFFRTNDTGLAVGRRGQIYRTIDGGKQWEDRRLKDDSTTWFTSALFLTDSIALATGLTPGANMDGVLYRSTDAGITWKKLDITGMRFGELFVGKGVPVCFQSYGKLHYSTDMGATWQSLATVSGKPGRSTAFYNNTGIICGSDAMCAFSSDRGKTWTSVPLEGEAALTSSLLISDSLGFVAGTGGHILATRDGGRTWKKEVPLPVTVDFADLASNGKRIFAVGASGFILFREIKE
ncbi:MAG: hypothetical protein IPH75_13615 [bacterium]|nr:hypothetical protein [bacterium]